MIYLPRNYWIPNITAKKKQRCDKICYIGLYSCSRLSLLSVYFNLLRLILYDPQKYTFRS